jgi:hypothetical protein
LKVANALLAKATRIANDTGKSIATRRRFRSRQAAWKNGSAGYSITGSVRPRQSQRKNCSKSRSMPDQAPA